MGGPEGKPGHQHEKNLYITPGNRYEIRRIAEIPGEPRLAGWQIRLPSPGIHDEGQGKAEGTSDKTE